MKNYFLQPENILITNKPSKITTVLGSCVSVCLYDTRLKYGGMNHYLLPVCENDTNKTKSGNKAIIQLINEMLSQGSRKTDLKAYVAGGASLIKNSPFSVGTKNIRIAQKILKEERIPIMQTHFGGFVGRKIAFYPHEGTFKIYMIDGSDPSLSNVIFD